MVELDLKIPWKHTWRNGYRSKEMEKTIPIQIFGKISTFHFVLMPLERIYLFALHL